MGVFDKLNERLKNIKFGSALKPFEHAAEPLTLEGDTAGWATRAATHLGIDEGFARFSDHMKQLVTDVTAALGPLTSEETIKRLPERARTINQIHANELAQKVKKVLASVKFTDLYQFDDAHQTFLQAVQEFRDSSARNTTALREHMGEQVDTTLNALQRLEDETIVFAQLLEEQHFPHLKRLKQAHQELVVHDERRAKEEELLSVLGKDKERTDARIQDLEKGTSDEEAKIRNEDAREALTHLITLEEELDRRVGPLQLAARDAIKFYRKYPTITPPSGARQVLEELDRDAARTLSQDSDRIGIALASIAEQVTQESKSNTRPLATKLERVSQQIDEVAAKARSILPEQTLMRQRIMRDVAALSAYDKRQFLLAARREAATLSAKMDFLNQELAPEKRIAHERAIKDAALALGASIPGEVPPVTSEPVAKEPAPQDDVAQSDDEIAKAEATLEKAQEVLTGNKKAKKRKGKR